ncbi:MAG: cell division ATP-binding protein FtsE, partial [Marinomonas sp.]
ADPISYKPRMSDAGQTPDTIVSFDNVGLRYGTDTEVLRDLSFTLFPGSFYFLTGASGAGKTSLLKLLYLAQRPSRGVVKMFDRDMITMPRSDLPAFRRRIGVVFQDFRLVEHMNAFDNVALPLRVAGVREADLKQPVTEMLSWVGLAHRIEAFPTTLSGGEQQRVAIARAVIGRPDILVADEPTGNVDPEMALKLMRMFEALNRLGTTVVVATHDVQLLKKVPESLIMRLDKGKLSDPTGALKYPPRNERRSEKRPQKAAPKPRTKAAAPQDADDEPIDLGPGFKPRKPFGRGKP